MEIVSAFVILMLICGLTIGSTTAIQQSRLRHCVETVKLKCEEARELAKMRGENAYVDIAKVEDGVKITVYGENILREETIVSCGRVELFYKKGGTDTPYQLGVVNSSDVAASITDTLTIAFSGGDCSIISRPMIDCIIFANGSKNHTLFFQRKSGAVLYEHEVDLLQPEQSLPGTKTMVTIPSFTERTDNDGRVVLIANGKTLQPQFAYDATYVKVSGVYRAKESSASPYVIIFELKDPYSTVWADGTSGQVRLEWIIVNVSE